jgi:hypothetical protein
MANSVIRTARKYVTRYADTLALPNAACFHHLPITVLAVNSSCQSEYFQSLPEEVRENYSLTHIPK